MLDKNKNAQVDLVEETGILPTDFRIVVSIHKFTTVIRLVNNRLHYWPVCPREIDATICEILRHKPNIVDVKNTITISVSMFRGTPAPATAALCAIAGYVHV